MSACWIAIHGLRRTHRDPAARIPQEPGFWRFWAQAPCVELLLLDEPTAGLDPEQRLRFRELVSNPPNRPTVPPRRITGHHGLCERVIVVGAARSLRLTTGRLPRPRTSGLDRQTADAGAPLVADG
jgi:hypothetical protein